MRRMETREGKNQFVSFCFARRWRSETEIFRLEMSIVINRQFMAANAAAPASSLASPPLRGSLPRRRHLPTNWRRAPLQAIIRNLWPVHTDGATQSVSPEAAPKTSLLKSPHQNANWFKISTLNYIIYANLFIIAHIIAKLIYLSALRFSCSFHHKNWFHYSVALGLSVFRRRLQFMVLWFCRSLSDWRAFHAVYGHGKHTSGLG